MIRPTPRPPRDARAAGYASATAKRKRGAPTRRLRRKAKARPAKRLWTKASSRISWIPPRRPAWAGTLRTSTTITSISGAGPCGNCSRIRRRMVRASSVSSPPAAICAARVSSACVRRCARRSMSCGSSIWAVTTSARAKRRTSSTSRRQWPLPSACATTHRNPGPRRACITPEWMRIRARKSSKASRRSRISPRCLGNRPWMAG